LSGVRAAVDDLGKPYVPRDHGEGPTSYSCDGLVHSVFTDAGLKHLKGLKKMQKLSLINTKVSDAGRDHLKQIPQLPLLNIQGTKITNAGVQDAIPGSYVVTLNDAVRANEVTAERIAGRYNADVVQTYEHVLGGFEIKAKKKDAEKLAAKSRRVLDLIREADFWAGEVGADLVRAEHVDRAVEAWTDRSSRLRDRLLEEIVRDTIYIDTDGEKVGQVNGLSVLQLGDYSFGRPNRITARVRMGTGKVVDIEREVELGGPIHSKGVLILSSYLGATFCQDRPLALAASLVFEQSYSGVEGDSASSAELFALLSAIGGIPLRQSVAVTGSVNQHGQIQPIGGVNEKIEGFFDLCRERGLDGEQGVIIPASNGKHLMLRPDVVQALDRIVERRFVSPALLGEHVDNDGLTQRGRVLQRLLQCLDRGPVIQQPGKTIMVGAPLEFFQELGVANRDSGFLPNDRHCCKINRLKCATTSWRPGLDYSQDITIRNERSDESDVLAASLE
jgi:hypothetical protein